MPDRTAAPITSGAPTLAAGARSLAQVRHFVGGKGALVVVAITSLLAGFAEAALLYVVVQIAAAISAGEDAGEIAVGPIGPTTVAVDRLCLIGAGVLVLLLVLALINSYAGAKTMTTTLNRTRKQAFGAFVSAEWSIQSQEPEGRLQQVLGGHIQRVGMAVLQVTNGITAFLQFLTLLASAVVVDAVGAGLVLFAIVVIGAGMVPITRTMRRLSRQAMEINMQYTRLVAQSVRVAREIRVYGVGDAVSERIGERADEAEELGLRSRFLTKFTPSLYQYLALLIVVGALAVISATDSIEVGNLGAIVLLFVRALSYGQRVNSSMQSLGEAQPFLESVLDQTQRYESQRMAREGRALGAVADLRCEGVGFSYDGEHEVLTEVDFLVERGECIGIVGPSGGGKSTLVQILLRLRHPDTGRYLVNGVDAAGYAYADWSERFAFVPQDNLLVAGSVTDNILFYRSGFGPADAERAARLAHLHEAILELPGGYDTQLGAGVRDLSGGQRQRLGLARALVGSPDVLVLDEPTSALDMASEQLIQQTLAELQGTRTMFIIAHRMPTLGMCDRIFVLEQGRLVASGPHAELQRDSEFYREALRLSQIAG